MVVGRIAVLRLNGRRHFSLALLLTAYVQFVPAATMSFLDDEAVETGIQIESDGYSSEEIPVSQVRTRKSRKRNLTGP